MVPDTRVLWAATENTMLNSHVPRRAGVPSAHSCQTCLPPMHDESQSCKGAREAFATMTSVLEGPESPTRAWIRILAEACEARTDDHRVEFPLSNNDQHTLFFSYPATLEGWKGKQDARTSLRRQCRSVCFSLPRRSRTSSTSSLIIHAFVIQACFRTRELSRLLWS